MRLSLFVFCCGFGEEEKSGDEFWILWVVREGRRERVRENMVVFWRMVKNAETVVLVPKPQDNTLNSQKQ